MKPMKKLLLLGGGGHCASIADCLLESALYDEIALVDTHPGPALFGRIPVVGTDDDLRALFAAGYHYGFVSLGSVGDTRVRRKLSSLLQECGFEIPNIIAPSAYVSPFAKLGQGIFVGRNAIVNARAEIGTCAIINTGAIVEHDCRVGAYAHISPSAVLCGTVCVGDDTHIGANAVIRQGLSVGARSIIGIGSVVTKAISDDQVAYGDPCVEVSRK